MNYLVQFTYEVPGPAAEWHNDCTFDDELDARFYMQSMRRVHEGEIPHRLLVVLEEFS